MKTIHPKYILSLPVLLLAVSCATNGERYEQMRGESSKPLSELAPAQRAMLPEPWRSADAEIDPFADDRKIDLDKLIAEVLRRNPTLVAMHQAWRAAIARYPQVTSFDDPMLAYSIAPRTTGEPMMGIGDVFEGSQTIPWPGKLTLRGEIALEDANSARQELETAAQRLKQETKLAFFDYYFIHRAEEINRINQNLLQQFRENAETRYASGTASKQDALQAEVELARLLQQALTLERLRKGHQARINALLNRRPDHSLPLPPDELSVDPARLDSEILRAAAIDSRSELQAMAARVRARAAQMKLARKNYFPDLTVMGTYNTMWEMLEMRPMVGAGVNLPIQIGRRKAAEEEALAEFERLRAELGSAIADVSFQVQTAIDETDEAAKALHLFISRLVPAAEENLEAARSGYVAGTVDFMALLTAQKNRMDMELSYQEAIVALHQRLADLDRAIGMPLEEITLERQGDKS